MTTNMRRLLDILAQDKEFLDKQDEICGMQEEEAKAWMIERAAREGIELTDQDLGPTEIESEELEDVSGGKMYYDLKVHPGIHTDCFCIAGGGGTGDRFQSTCACVAGGAGKLKDGRTAMWCVGFGMTKTFGFDEPLFEGGIGAMPGE